MNVETYARGPFLTNTFLLLDGEGKQAFLVDPTIEIEDLADEFERRGLELQAVVNTHCHLDHSYGNRYFCERFGVPLWAHREDLPLLQNMEKQAVMFGFDPVTSPEPDRFLEEGESIALGEDDLAVLHTPGHSPGGICLATDGLVVVGDTLFAGSIGRTDLWGGSFPTLRDSIHEKIFTLPDTTRVLPGHGPETTVGAERRGNPFVGENAVFGDGDF